ncbi:Phosphatidylinositol-glycan biosynthesis class X protein, partial [Microtus ochrogaster]
AADAVAWLLLWAAGLVGRLAADISDAPFSSGIRATCSEIILRQEFLKDGFHRDLLVKVKFGESIEDLQTCRLLIKHHIPAGLFVDPYELASLRERNVTEAVMLSESFNIEAPNYLSKESAVLIYARQDAQCIDCFQASLPVHYRYHRPHRKDGDTLIVINNPDLLMYCDQALARVVPAARPGSGGDLPSLVSADALARAGPPPSSRLRGLGPAARDTRTCERALGSGRWLIVCSRTLSLGQEEARGAARTWLYPAVLALLYRGAAPDGSGLFQDVPSFTSCVRAALWLRIPVASPLGSVCELFLILHIRRKFLQGSGSLRLRTELKDLLVVFA